jgi:ParB/RepB/Spo0J family partition protein
MDIIYLSIKDIKPYEKNPRQISQEAIEKVANSIREFGFKVPAIVDKNNVLVCGHTRFLAAKKLGLKEIPCIMADDLTEEQIRAFRIADNKTAELSEWNQELLSEEIANIFDIDMNDLGFDLKEKIKEDLKEVEDEMIVCPVCGMHFIGKKK